MSLLPDRNQRLDKKLEEELNKLDEVYIHAYETRSINCLKSCAKPEFLYKLARIAVLRPRYFSDKIYRKNTWELLATEGAIQSLRKTCNYQSVRLGAIKKVKIATDYSELWQVARLSNVLTIIDIKEDKDE